MNLIIGSLWEELGKADLLLFPANNVIDKSGALVMGAGVAKQFKVRFPDIPHLLGDNIRERLPFYGVATEPLKWADGALRIGAFQTKYHWRDPSPLELIGRSAAVLGKHASRFSRIAMPLPGCGLGGLNEIDVLPILESLPDNVFIYKLP